jgi:hypothetical protein
MPYPIETVLPYSIEGFLSREEISHIIAVIDAFKEAHPDRLQAGTRGFSVHRDSALSLEEVVASFEPKGRLDINSFDLPDEVIDVGETAFYRRIEDIRRVYPGALGPVGFTYVEYGPGQFFTPHIDGATEIRVAGFGACLNSDFEGGEFRVETCGSGRLWVQQGNGEIEVAPFPSQKSDWYRNLPRTQWTTRPVEGNAIFYGGGLTHSMKPVTAGVLKKLLAFVSSVPAPPFAQHSQRLYDANVLAIARGGPKP